MRVWAHRSARASSGVRLWARGVARGGGRRAGFSSGLSPWQWSGWSAQGGESRSGFGAGEVWASRSRRAARGGRPSAEGCLRKSGWLVARGAPDGRSSRPIILNDMRGEMNGLGARRASGRPRGGGSHLPLCQALAGAPAKRQVAQVGDVETKAGRQAGRLAGRQAGSSCWQAAEALRSSAAGSACARWSCESRGRDGAARACASARPSRAAISASSRQKGAVGVVVVLRRPAALRARLCGRPWLRAGGAAGRRSAPAALGRSIRPAPLAPAFGAVGLCCTPRRDVRANFLMRAPTAPSGGSGALRASAGRRWVALGAARFPAIRANLCLNAAAKRKEPLIRHHSLSSFLSWTSLLIGTNEGTHNMTPNTRLHAQHRTSHPRPPPPRPPPRLGGKEMRRWDSEGGAQTRMGGFSCAPRCPAFLTFRDSPALVRQESDGYPVRPVASTPTPTAHSPLLVPPSNAPDPDKPPDVGPLPRTLPPLCPSHTPRPDMHIQDKPGVLLSKEKEKRE